MRSILSTSCRVPRGSLITPVPRWWATSVSYITTSWCLFTKCASCLKVLGMRSILSYLRLQRHLFLSSDRRPQQSHDVSVGRSIWAAESGSRVQGLHPIFRFRCFQLAHLGQEVDFRRTSLICPRRTFSSALLNLRSLNESDLPRALHLVRLLNSSFHCIGSLLASFRHLLGRLLM